MRATKKLSVWTLFLTVMLIGAGGGQKAYAKTTALESVCAKHPDAQVKQISTQGDITTKLVELFETSKDGEEVIIYIPSGNYTIKDDKKLLLHSDNIIVMESDTKISKQGGSNAIFRTRALEKVKNIQIIGGQLDGQGKGAIDIYEAGNVTIDGTKINNSKAGIKISKSTNTIIKNVTVKKSSAQGIYISKSTGTIINNATVEKSGGQGIYILSGSTVAMDQVTIKSSKTQGISVNLESKATIHNITVKASKGTGMSVGNKSIVHVKDSTFSGNNWSGFSATGSKTKVYIANSTFSNNGVKPKTSGDGAIGHGIGISGSAYGEIKNSTIAENHECGISVFNGSKVKLDGNIISKNGRHGIGARQKVNLVDVRNNTISKNGYDGIMVADRSKMIAYNNKVTSNKVLGISVSKSSTVSLKKTKVSKNKTGNIWRDATSSITEKK
ncbi:right-handed parallel beta-helix repeat-containing protein [Lachnospiraceae bacterium ZAX-1]